MTRSAVWNALTSTRLFTSSLFPVFVSVVIYVILRYNVFDIMSNSELSNRVIFHTANTVAIERNHIPTNKLTDTNNSIGNSMINNKSTNLYLTPEAHTSIRWLNHTMHASFFKEWYKVSSLPHNNIINNTDNNSISNDSSSDSNANVNKTYQTLEESLVKAGDVLLPLHVWYLYLAGQYMNWSTWLCNSLLPEEREEQQQQYTREYFVSDIANTLHFLPSSVITVIVAVIKSIPFILLPHHLYFQLSPIYMCAMLFLLYCVCKKLMSHIAILLLCALERRAMTTLVECSNLKKQQHDESNTNNSNVSNNNNNDNNNKENNTSITKESCVKRLSKVETQEQLHQMGFTHEHVNTLQHRIVIIGTFTLLIPVFSFALVLEVATFHPVCLSATMLLYVIDALLREEIACNALSQQGHRKETRRISEVHIDHAINELYIETDKNYKNQYCTENPVLLQGHLFYCVPRMLPSISPLLVASMLMSVLCFMESYYLYLIPLFVLWGMTSCYRRAFRRVLICVKQPDEAQCHDANEYGYVEIGLSSYHDKWYLLKCVGNVFTPAVLCVLVLLLCHEPTSNLSNIFNFIELFGKPPFPVVQAISSKRIHSIDNTSESSIMNVSTTYKNDNNTSKENWSVMPEEEMDDNSTLVHMMRSWNNNIEYANQWTLSISLTGGLEWNKKCACNVTQEEEKYEEEEYNYYEHYSECTRPIVNVWSLTEYIGIPWSEMVMRVALMLTSVNENATSLELSSSPKLLDSNLSATEIDYLTRAIADSQLMLDYFSLVIVVVINAISFITLAFYRLQRPPAYFDNPKAFLSAQASYEAERSRVHQRKFERKTHNTNNNNKQHLEQQHLEQQEQREEKKEQKSSEERCSTNYARNSEHNVTESSSYKDVTKTCVCAHEYILKHILIYIFMSVIAGLSCSLFLIRTSELSITCAFPLVAVVYAVWQMNACLREEMPHVYSRPAAMQITCDKQVIKNNSQNDEKDKFFVQPKSFGDMMDGVDNAFAQTTLWCVSSPLSLFEQYDVIWIVMVIIGWWLAFTGSFISTCVGIVLCCTVLKYLLLTLELWYTHLSHYIGQIRTINKRVMIMITLLLTIVAVLLSFFCTSIRSVITFVSPINRNSLLQKEHSKDVSALLVNTWQYALTHFSDLLCISTNMSDDTMFTYWIATRVTAVGMFCGAVALIWLRLIHLGLQPDEVHLSISN